MVPRENAEGQVLTALSAAASGNVTASTSQMLQGTMVNFIQQKGAAYIGDLVRSGQLKEGSPEHAALHAIIAAAGAKASGQDPWSGAAGAASSSLLTNLFSDDPSLTESQKEDRRNLMTTLVTGMATALDGNAATANNAAFASLDNNYFGESVIKKAREAVHAANVDIQTKVSAGWKWVNGKLVEPVLKQGSEVASAVGNSVKKDWKRFKTGVVGGYQENGVLGGVGGYFKENFDVVLDVETQKLMLLPRIAGGVFQADGKGIALVGRTIGFDSLENFGRDIVDYYNPLFQDPSLKPQTSFGYASKATRDVADAYWKVQTTGPLLIGLQATANKGYDVLERGGTTTQAWEAGAGSGLLTAGLFYIPTGNLGGSFVESTGKRLLWGTGVGTAVTLGNNSLDLIYRPSSEVNLLDGWLGNTATFTGVAFAQPWTVGEKSGLDTGTSASILIPSRQTMATGSEWYDYFANQYGAQNVDWTSGSGRTITWPLDLPMPATTSMIRVPPPQRSGIFIRELVSVAGPRPLDAIGHHTQPLGLGGLDSGILNGTWVFSGPHTTGHGTLNPQVNIVPYGTQIRIKPQ